jgi:hypothetical protein
MSERITNTLYRVCQTNDFNKLKKIYFKFDLTSFPIKRAFAIAVSYHHFRISNFLLQQQGFDVEENGDYALEILYPLNNKKACRYLHYLGVYDKYNIILVKLIIQNNYEMLKFLFKNNFFMEYNISGIWDAISIMTTRHIKKIIKLLIVNGVDLKCNDADVAWIKRNNTPVYNKLRILGIIKTLKNNTKIKNTLCMYRIF